MTDKLVEELVMRKGELACRITELHFSRNSDLNKRYSEQEYQRLYEDTVYHLDYLIEAVRVDSTKLFNHYLAWVWRMRLARNIPREDFAYSIGYIEQAISEKIERSGKEVVYRILETGTDHLLNQEIHDDTYLLKVNPLYDEAKQYLSLLLDAKRKQAAELIDELVKGGTQVQDIYEHIFQVTQYEIGLLWHRNKITVANEHYCTAATQLIMSRLYSIIFSSRKRGYKLVAFSVSNDLHELGIRMVSDFFEMEGWDTYYMGSIMSNEDLIKSIREHEADVLALSVTMPTLIGKAKTLIDDIRSLDEFNELKIMAGGYPFGIVPDLQKHIGADATAPSAREAVEIANDMMR